MVVALEVCLGCAGSSLAGGAASGDVVSESSLVYCP